MALALPAALRHPLLERDYARLCSRPAAFLSRAGAAAGLGTFVLFTYADDVDWQSPDRLGRTLHMMFSWMAMLFVFGQSLTECALAVPTERSANTLQALLTAPISPRRLAAGFLLSRVLFACTILLGVLPVEGITLLVGGVSGMDLLYSLGAILVAGAYGAGIGFLAGHGAVNGRFAVARAGGAALWFVFLLPGFSLLVAYCAHEGWLPLLESGGKGWEDSLLRATAWIFCTTPGGSFLHVLQDGDPGSRFPGRGEALLLAAASAVVWILLALLSAGRRLRLETELGAVSATRRTLRQAIRDWFRKEPAAAAGRSSRRRGEDLSLDYRPTVWRLPLLWKESRPPRAWAARGGMWTAYVLFFALYAWLFLDPRIQKEFLRGPEYFVYDFFVCVPLWVAALFLSIPGASFLAEEREKGALDLLRAAPLGPRQWILSRAVGTGLRMAPLLGTILFFLVAGVFTGQVHALTPVAGLLGFACVLPFLALLSFQRGISAPSIRVANRRAAGLLLTLLFFLPMITGFLTSYFRWRDDGLILLALNPLFSMAGPLVLLVHQYDPDKDALRFAVSGCIACGVWAALGALFWFLLPRMLTEGLHRDEKR